MKRGTYDDAMHGYTRRLDRVVQARDGKVVVNELEDCEPVLEAAKRLGDLEPAKEPFRHAAYIPRHVLNRAYREGWFNDEEAWKKWANDPNNKHLRTWKGRM